MRSIGPFAVIPDILQWLFTESLTHTTLEYTIHSDFLGLISTEGKFITNEKHEATCWKAYSSHMCG